MSMYFYHTVKVYITGSIENYYTMHNQQSTRWTARPTRTGIRQASTPTSYDNGLSYYTAGRIQSAYIKGNVLQAVVAGGSKYHVEVKDAGLEGLVGDCTCSYNSKHYGICKHVVAVLMHLMDHLDEMLVEEDTRETTIKYMIGRISPQDALEFLATVMMDDEDTRQQFIKKFGLEHIRLQRDYRAEIDRMYRDAAEADGKVYANLDFEGYFTNARESQHTGEMDSATRMFRDMSEIISERMIMVDDSDGYYTDCFIEALENMVESLVRERLAHEQKREYISYLLGRFVAEIRPKFIPQYRSALETICTQREDLAYWQEQMAPHLDKLVDSDDVPRNTVDLVLMQAYVLGELKDDERLASLLAGFYHLDKKLCMMYLDAIRNISPAKARKAAQEIVEKYSDDTDIIERAFEFYAKSSRGYAVLLRRMFITTGDWKYFFMLKEVSKNWDAEMRSMVKECIKKSDPKKAMEIYLKEDSIAEAMKQLESWNDIDLFETFRTRLARRYPSRYFAAYGAKIIEEAGSRQGKKHYERIQKHLLSLRAVPGSEAKYDDICAAIKNKNPTKRALLSAIDDI